MDKNLNFGKFGQNTVLPQRPVAPHRIPSDISFDFEKSPGDRPAVAYMPHRYAPTIKVIQTTSGEKMGIAIPKGTIVSAIPVLNSASYGASGVGDSSIANTDGEQALGINILGDVIYADIDNPLQGYGKVRNAAVIANGGISVADNYNQYDVDTARVKLDGSVISINDIFFRKANIPLGIAMTDIYINREGQYLNASESPFLLFDSLLSDWLIAVPFVLNGGSLTGNISVSVSTFNGTTLAADVASGATSITVNDASGIEAGYIIRIDDASPEDVTVASVSGNTITLTAGVANAHTAGASVVPVNPIYGQKTMSNGYSAIYNKGYSLLIAENKEDILELGNLVTSNVDGKYKPQYTASDSLTGVANAQTIGKIISVDNKFPKDLEDMVQTYPYNHSGGTSTFGLPMELYSIVYDVFTANGVPVNQDNIAQGLNDLEFGYVWINVHVN